MERVRELERRVGNGDVHAMHALAELVEDGFEGVAKDLTRAKQLYEGAAEGGLVDAMFNLGNLLHNGGDGVPKNLARAAYWYERAAEVGNLVAMFRLGALCCIGGEDIAKDAMRAKRWFERAAEGGDIGSMTALGLLLAHGHEDVAKDVVRAKEVLERAAKGGDLSAMRNLAAILKNGVDGVVKDAICAKQWYERAAEEGDLAAMFELGLLYMNGDEGIAKDAMRAKRWFERAAKGGHIRSMVRLGMLLSSGGDDMDKDVSRAKQLYERAAEGGSLHAMRNLGILLEKGADAVAEDVVRAKQLFEKAADGGDVPAQGIVGDCLRRGCGAFQKNPVRAKEFLERAATAGDTDAMVSLAKLLRRGYDGVPKDTTRALELYERAGVSRHEISLGLEEGRSVLSDAFSNAMRDSSVVTEAFLTENIVVSNVCSAADLFWGHNLILLSIRSGVLTLGNIRTLGGSGWDLRENLYHLASKQTEENEAVIGAICQHAGNLGIITNGYGQREERVNWETNLDLKGIEKSIQILCRRAEARNAKDVTRNAAVIKLSRKEERLEKSIDVLTCNLNQLKEVHKAEAINWRRRSYAQIARCMLAFISLIENASDQRKSSFTAISVLMNMRTDDLVPAGLDVTKAIVNEMAWVDLFNLQVARYAFSEQVMLQLNGMARSAVALSVCASDFKSLGQLQIMLEERIEAMVGEDVSMAMMDIGSSSWMLDGVNDELPSNVEASEATSSSEADELDALEEKTRRYFQSLIQGTGRDKVGIPGASEGVSDLLKDYGGLSEVQYNEVEDIFFELAGDYDDEVTEQLFVDILGTVFKRQEKERKMAKVMEEAKKRFRERVHREQWLSVKYAARVMCTLFKDMEEGGFVEAGMALGQEKAVEALCKTDANKNGKVEEAGLVATIRQLLTKG